MNITINNIQLQVASGLTILETAKSQGIDIPTLCHSECLSLAGACRLCVVEVDGSKKLLAGCVTPVTEGMIIYTDSPKVVEARKTILELLLANHPLDCLTCEKSGTCSLQEYCYKYGVKTSSFLGEKHEYSIDESNPYIIKDNNKCILCGKCVRACAEIKEANILDFTQRSIHTKVTTAFDKPMAESDCVSCHNCIAVCPVGALTARELKGKGRHWQLTTETVTCSFCEEGCQFYLYKKGDKTIGVGAKEPAPGKKMCLKGRLGLNYLYNEECPPKAQIKKDGVFTEVDWLEALGLTKFLQK